MRGEAQHQTFCVQSGHCSFLLMHPLTCKGHIFLQQPASKHSHSCSSQMTFQNRLKASFPSRPCYLFTGVMTGPANYKVKLYFFLPDETMLISTIPCCVKGLLLLSQMSLLSPLTMPLPEGRWDTLIPQVPWTWFRNTCFMIKRYLWAELSTHSWSNRPSRYAEFCEGPLTETEQGRDKRYHVRERIKGEWGRQNSICNRAEKGLEKILCAC